MYIRYTISNLCALEFVRYFCYNQYIIIRQSEVWAHFWSYPKTIEAMKSPIYESLRVSVSKKKDNQERTNRTTILPLSLPPGWCIPALGMIAVPERSPLLPKLIEKEYSFSSMPSTWTSPSLSFKPSTQGSRTSKSKSLRTRLKRLCFNSFTKKMMSCLVPSLRSFPMLETITLVPSRLPSGTVTFKGTIFFWPDKS